MPQDTHPAPAPPQDIEWPVEPDISNVVIDDGAPVDNVFTEKQERLLTEPLYSSWTRPEGGKFCALANVGLFYHIDRPPYVPDMMLILDVELQDYISHAKKSRRSYFTWVYGKLPEVAIEVVSNKEGNETAGKLKDYAAMRILYYVIFDPEQLIQSKPLQIYLLNGLKYVPHEGPLLQEIGLGLELWKGTFETMQDTWLRWTDSKGVLIPTGFERAERERQRADRLAARLRALGENPDQ